MENKTSKKYQFQEWVINTLTNILKNYNGEDFNEHGYKYSLKNGIVCHYASMYYNVKQKEYVNFWQTNFFSKRSKKYKNAHMVLLLSNCAKEEIQKMQNGDRSFKDEKNSQKNLHWEHIAPNGYVYEKLLKLLENKTRENKVIREKDVESCFRHHRLVLLLKDEENKYLDGSGCKFDERDEDTLNRWNKLVNDDLTEDIESIKENGKYLRCKDCGSALARMAHLYNSKVFFTKYDSNEEHEPNNEEKYVTFLIEYLENKDFEFNK